MIYVSAKQLAGTVAMWAVRQSPYQVPEGLADVVKSIHTKFEPDASGFDFRMFQDSGELRAYVRNVLRSMPQYMAWNERKNGNDAPHKFSSRYDIPGNPDDDFIDLDALEQNVTRTIASEE